MLFVYTKNPTLTHTPYANDLFTFLSGNSANVSIQGLELCYLHSNEKFCFFFVRSRISPNIPVFQEKCKSKNCKKAYIKRTMLKSQQPLPNVILKCP